MNRINKNYIHLIQICFLFIQVLSYTYKKVNRYDTYQRNFIPNNNIVSSLLLSNDIDNNNLPTKKDMTITFVTGNKKKLVNKKKITILFILNYMLICLQHIHLLYL